MKVIEDETYCVGRYFLPLLVSDPLIRFHISLNSLRVDFRAKVCLHRKRGGVGLRGRDDAN